MGVVGVLEGAGHRVLRTYNEARARLATDEELQAFGVDSGLQPLHGRVVLEITHGTYGAQDEALGRPGQRAAPPPVTSSLRPMSADDAGEVGAVGMPAVDTAGDA